MASGASGTVEASSADNHTCVSELEVETATLWHASLMTSSPSGAPSTPRAPSVPSQVLIAGPAGKGKPLVSTVAIVLDTEPTALAPAVHVAIGGFALANGPVLNQA